MLLNISASREILIHSSAERIWEVLTSPLLIKEYLFGTSVNTDWQPNKPVVFSGFYNGAVYTDKGTVLTNTPLRELSYTYLSSFSGLEDKPENYSIITLILENSSAGILLTWKHTGYKTEEMRAHSENMITSVLKSIKEIAERE